MNKNENITKIFNSISKEFKDYLKDKIKINTSLNFTFEELLTEFIKFIILKSQYNDYNDNLILPPPNIFIIWKLFVTNTHEYIRLCINICRKMVHLNMNLIQYYIKEEKKQLNNYINSNNYRNKDLIICVGKTLLFYKDYFNNKPPIEIWLYNCLLYSENIQKKLLFIKKSLYEINITICSLNQIKIKFNFNKKDKIEKLREKLFKLTNYDNDHIDLIYNSKKILNDKTILDIIDEEDSKNNEILIYLKGFLPKK